MNTKLFSAVGIIAERIQALHPECSDRYRRTELGAGRMFADCFEDCARFSLGERAWRVYDGQRWAIDAGGARTAELCKLLADSLLRYAASIPDPILQEPFSKFAASWQKRHFREVVLADAASVHPIEPNSFDRDDWVLNVANGELDLHTLELHPHRPESLLSKLAAVDYNPDAKCSRWDSFLDEISCGNTELAAFIQRAFGYSMTGDTSQECYFVLHGSSTRNGKSTLAETFKAMLGDYACSAQPDTFTERKFANGGAPSEDLARLAGRRFITLPEPDGALTVSASRLKQFTGSDTLTARMPYESSIEFIPRGKLFFSTNVLPRCADAAIFNSGRVHVIPFDRHFDPAEQDHELKGYFKRPENLSAVLNWGLEGLQLYQSDGLAPPVAVLETTAQYAEREGSSYVPMVDSIARFIEEAFESDPFAETRSSTAYAAYLDWCTQNQISASMSIQGFGRSVKRWLPMERRRPRNGGNVCTMIPGYRLRES